MRTPSLNLSLGRGRPTQLVGLDIQPGYITAVQAHVNGRLVVERAAGMPLPGDAMREGEVIDGGALASALRELFSKSKLDKRVRVGVANQRTVLRMLELPPLSDRKELAAAVRFQAEDQVPMPLDNAVLDFHPVGVVETPSGTRQRVAVVAAQRDMIEKLLNAVRAAGLRPEAIDLSAFALIRALHKAPDGTPQEGDAPMPGAGRVLYLNVGGLTNLAIADGAVCRFTRVTGGGLESMAVAVAERHGLPLSEARELIAQADLTPAPPAAFVPQQPVEPVPAPAAHEPFEPFGEQAPEPHAEPAYEQPTVVQPAPAEPVPAAPVEETVELDAADEQPAAVYDIHPVLEGGVREIAGEVRNSLDFHRSQEGGGEVARIVLSGPALAIRGFKRALSAELGIEVDTQTVGFLQDRSGGDVPVEHLSVAAGLAVEEAPGQ